MRSAQDAGRETGSHFCRCLNCGAERAEDQCAACGLDSSAAEVVLRRRLLNRTAVFLLGGVAFLAASHFYPPLDLDTMLIFVGAVSFVTLTLAVLLDRRARRHVELELLQRVFAGFIPVLWLLAALLFVNGRFDTAPPRELTTRVVGKFTMPGSLRSSRLVVLSWRAERRIERVPISRDDYMRFQHGDAVILRVQDGAVGIPWIYSVHRR